MDKRNGEELPYTYERAGFNGFLRRSIDSQPAMTLGQRSAQMIAPRIINFDQQQVGGALGDILQLGKIHIDGRNGRISVFDTDGNEVARFGKLED